MAQYRKQVMPIPHRFKYEAMPRHEREQLLPERNVCSLHPADNWDDAFITGNGTQRLDVLGDPYYDRLTLTHEALYEPRWARTPEPPDLTGIMPTVRRLMREGKFKEAADLVEQETIKHDVYAEQHAKDPVMPIWSLRRHHAIRLHIRQEEAGSTRRYLRWLDMMTGCVTVQWENDLGRFKREALASYEGDTSAIRLTSERAGTLNAEIELVLPFKHPDYGGRESINDPDKCSHRLLSQDDTIALEFAYYPEYGQKGYCTVIRFVNSGGTAMFRDNKIVVEGADSLLLLSRTVKYEGGFSFGCSASLVEAISGLEADFDRYTAANLAHIGSRMDRSRIRLGTHADHALSSEELLRTVHTTQEFAPALLEKLYDMGRFFLITDTGEIPPMWGQHNINTNLQVCAGNNTGLFDEMDVYFRYYETKFDDFRTNARKLYNARGLLASVHCDYDSGLFYHYSKTYPHYAWTGCLGWIYNEFWGYYLVTGDNDFLRERVVPALKEIALFFEDYAIDRDDNGRVIFYPSFSPENPTPAYMTSNGVYAASINSVMDIMICREVLDNLITACNWLGIEQENIPHWEKQLESLPEYLLDEEGGLKEWAWPSINENYDHRHVSHHYGVWPDRHITWEDQPHLAHAIQISNRKRAQQDDSAHGIIHRLFTAIRLKDLSETVQNLSQLMNHGFITRALTTLHYPYFLACPDLQGAFPAILLEMCVYSKPGTIEFLPAMPESLPSGRIQGVWLYTWAKLESLEWDRNGFTAHIVSDRDQTICLRNRRGTGGELLINGQPVRMDGDHVDYAFKKGEVVTVSAMWA